MNQKPIVTPTIKPYVGLAPANNNMDWFEVIPHLLAAGIWRILAIGPKSSGKTHTMMQWSGAKYIITMHQQISVEEILGSNTICKDGSIEFVYAAVARAMIEGEAIVINEIDLTGPNALGMMYGILDNDSHLIMPSGQIIRPKPGFAVLMNSNEGLSALPGPIADRIECVLHANTVNPEAFDKDCSQEEKILTNRFYKYLPKPLINIDPTPRKWRTYHQLLRAGIPQKLAMRCTFVDSASEIESTLANIAVNKDLYEKANEIEVPF